MNDQTETSTIDLKRVISLAKPHWKALVFATFALFMGSGLSLLYPQAARIGIDDVLVNKAKDLDLGLLGLALIGLFLFQAVFVSLRYYLFTVVGERVVADLRRSLYTAIVRQEIGFFDDTKTGELTSRLTSDTQILQNAVTSNLSMALRFGAQAVGGTIVLFLTSVKLASVIAIAVPGVVGISVYYGRKVRKLSRAVQDRLADSTAVAEETIGGIRTVRSFAGEENAKSRYGDAVEESFAAAKKRAIVGAVFGGGVTLIGYGTVAVVLWLGGTMVTQDDLTMGELTAFLLYTLMVAFSLGALSGLWTDFMKATGSAERVFQLIDRVPPFEVVGGQTPHLNGEVTFKDVSFRYPTRPEVDALQDVSFTMHPGTKVAVVGPSGAGKSTIGAMMLRFYDPNEGAILVDGMPLTELDPTALREQIGVVAQEPILFSGTIAENVRFAKLNATDSEVEDALRAANAWEFVSEFPDKVETVIGERGIRLSGGQKQRIAIARALLKDPKILILDEATSALDVESEALVQKALENLMRGRTTLIIAHRLSTVAGADRVLVLDRGKLVEDGTHSELVDAEGIYHRLIESQRLLA